MFLELFQFLLPYKEEQVDNEEHIGSGRSDLTGTLYWKGRMLSEAQAALNFETQFRFNKQMCIWSIEMMIQALSIEDYRE